MNDQKFIHYGALEAKEKAAYDFANTHSITAADHIRTLLAIIQDLRNQVYDLKNDNKKTCPVVRVDEFDINNNSARDCYKQIMKQVHEDGNGWVPEQKQKICVDCKHFVFDGFKNMNVGKCMIDSDPIDVKVTGLCDCYTERETEDAKWSEKFRERGFEAAASFFESGDQYKIHHGHR